MKIEVPAPATAQASAGALLRQARQAAGLSVATLAATMKLPEARLQALEDDNYAFFPDHVLMRALAQSLCRTLRADAAPVLALLPRPAQKNLLARGPDAVPTPFRPTSFQDGGTSGMGGLGGMRLWHWFGAAALLLGAGALIYFFPAPANTSAAPADGPGANGSGGHVVNVVNVVPLPGDAPATPPVAVSPVLAAPANPVDPLAPDAAALRPAREEPAPQSATPADVAAPALPAQPAAQNDSAQTALLHIHASAPSWVQVKNAAGRTLQQKTLAAGEALHIDSAEGGALPLAVVIGNAAAVQVQVRGQAMPLAARMREGVARFAVQ